MCEIVTQKIVPISYDMAFKKMWGDPDGPNRTALLLSVMLNIPYHVIEGKTEIIESEKRIKNETIKRQRCDVVVKVNLNIFDKVNLEVNLGFDKADIDRNISFLTHIFNSGIKNKMQYSKISSVLQINFNDYDVDRSFEEIVDKYVLQNKNGHKLTGKLQIWNINIAKCYDLWYNYDIENLSKEEQEIVKICALMYIKNKEDFEKCLEEINMEKNVKNDIKRTEEEFNEAEDIFSWYGTPEEYEALQEAKIYNATQEAVEKTTKQVTKQVTEKVTKQVSKQEKIEIAKRMIVRGEEIDYISEITELSKKDIIKLKEQL